VAAEDLAAFSETTRTWFSQSFDAPTPVQSRGWASIASGKHTLMLAPTGSGKTLAAFLWCLDQLSRETAAPEPGATRVIYVSPIKALAYDVERNLRAPLAGLQRLGAGTQIRVDVRTGDTPAKERERQRKDPGQILITTPESLYLLLAGRARDRLKTVDTIIVDEIHALAPTKRGIHLGLSLERLAYLVTSAGNPEPQRIGLSATQRPLIEVARYLGGDRPVEIVDASSKPSLDLEIVVPTADMDVPGPAPAVAGRRGGDVAITPKIDERNGFATPKSDGGGMWAVIYPRLLDEIMAHRSTIVFCNSRRLSERVAQQLTELAVQRGISEPGVELVRAHHGSVARHQRAEIEEALKAGRLRAITATSSLELGIDMGAVDLVIQVE
jgi:ATP-dependent Lhr-like helicase